MKTLRASAARAPSTSTHLIVGNTEDYHALAIAWALRRMGEQVLLWDGIGCTSEDCLSIAIPPADQAFHLGHDEVCRLKSVWFRRPIPFKPLVGVAQRDRKFATNELLSAHLSLCANAKNAAEFVVDSRPDDIRHSKAWQLRLAIDAGFTVPPTLVSNDYVRIRQFIAEHSPVIVKFFMPHFWTDLAAREMHDAGPRVLTPDTALNESSVRVCPAIYQRLVRKQYEIRVTVIGESIFAARISSRRGPAYLDWRPMCGKPDFMMTAMDLDTSVEDSVRKLMASLELHYACIDLAVDADGVVNFFEINAGGQFLFIEDYIPQFHLLGAFTAMLQSGSPRYEAPPRDEVGVERFESSAEFLRLRAPSALYPNARFMTELT